MRGFKILLRQRGDSIVADGLGADSLGQGREGSIVIDGAGQQVFLWFIYDSKDIEIAVTF